MYYLPVLIANHGPTTTSTSKRDGIITVKVKLSEEAVDDNGHERLRGRDDVLLHVLNTDHVDDSVEGGEGCAGHKLVEPRRGREVSKLRVADQGGGLGRVRVYRDLLRELFLIYTCSDTESATYCFGSSGQSVGGVVVVPVDPCVGEKENHLPGQPVVGHSKKF